MVKFSTERPLTFEYPLSEELILITMLAVSFLMQEFMLFQNKVRLFV